MGFPAGMQLATVAFGIPLTVTGKEVVTHVTVKPTARVIWAATGQPLPEFADSFTAEAGQMGTFQVPFIDQGGFIDSTGAAFTDWAYQITASWSFGNERPITWSKAFKPLVGQAGTIDLDLIPDGTVSIPVTAPTAAVLGFHGRTGFIEIQESDLPSRLSEASLSATYGPDAAPMKAAFAKPKDARSMLLRNLQPRDTTPAADTSLAPTITISGPTGAPPVAADVRIDYNTPLINMLGGVPTLRVVNGNNHLVNGCNDVTSGTGGTRPPYWMEFEYTGTNLTLGLTPETAAGYTIWIWVDGVPTTAAPAVGVGNKSAGSRDFYLLTFPSAATRRVKVFLANCMFYGVYTEAAGVLTPPKRLAPKIAVLGDSFIEGAQGVGDADLWAFRVPQLLGAEGYRCGQGGTGYAVAGARSVFGSTARLDALAAATPDLVVIYGSSNDDSASGAAVQSAAAAAYAGIGTRLPGVPVIVIGPYSAGTTPSASRQTNANSVKTAALAAGNVIGHIDPIAETWMTDTQWAALKAADNVHLNALGHGYWSRKVAARVREVFDNWVGQGQ